MNTKLLKIATGLALLPFCASTIAADATFTGTFKTIKNVTISEITPMVINGLHPETASECIMDTPDGSTAFPGETTMLIANTTAPYTLTPGADNGAMAAGVGGGCSSSVPGVPGIFEIDGAEGASVTITLATTAVVGGLAFTAVGCASDYDGLSDGDVCTPIIEGGAADVITLAAVGDQTVSAGQGQPVAGISRLALGGSVTSSIGLTAATAYVVPFDVVVTY